MRELRLACVPVGWMLAWSAAPAAAAQTPVAITDVTVIDATVPAPRPGQTVVLSGNRIVAAGPAATTPVPAGARVIPGRGKYLLPGLWDMHVHTVVPGGRGGGGGGPLAPA